MRGFQGPSEGPIMAAMFPIFHTQAGLLQSTEGSSAQRYSAKRMSPTDDILSTTSSGDRIPKLSRARSYILGVSTLTFSCMAEAHILPSSVSMTASRWVSLFPADTTRQSNMTEVLRGSGLWKTTDSDLLTPRLSQNPLLPTVKSAVELRLSNMVEAAPP